MVVREHEDLIKGEVPAELVGAVEDGVAGRAPENYADHDVTHDVADHNAYYLPEKGCIPQVVDNF